MLECEGQIVGGVPYSYESGVVATTSITIAAVDQTA
jgi:hypothetical protein